MSMWTSKLGQKYDAEWIRQQDPVSQQKLKALRADKQKGNDRCADCGKQDSSWASVSHGVFICVVCSDVHRSVGTHISKVKGCTGTYLWGPDELSRMSEIGNAEAEKRYGSLKVDPSASKEEKQRYVTAKYSQQPAQQESTSAVKIAPFREEVPQAVMQLRAPPPAVSRRNAGHAGSQAQRKPASALPARDASAEKENSRDLLDDFFFAFENQSCQKGSEAILSASRTLDNFLDDTLAAKQEKMSPDAFQTTNAALLMSKKGPAAAVAAAGVGDIFAPSQKSPFPAPAAAAPPAMMQKKQQPAAASEVDFFAAWGL
eukprot:CAMPEP_0178411016 /NCGR_PEP_ID=MMETSP0689_2-20121128/21279_1 /TAXON_ID=160604 /ORGANISM="Amphidinium massartii, Strain CS-259" /LENGTH=315 /DNA_ID=CAMNT_0020032213 /DNA_START=89 /DNA_END=1036 /DNA_ORIENTATION=+